ncbi:protein PSK SIMULATOR 1-like isoform X2 [Apium graveolens]|uniref:protein PSK SIMULATOR 1-like isoform X2 n=1 Tax=Apium graveolens TaxID=4045 RepID=UPI003D7BE118
MGGLCSKTSESDKRSSTAHNTKHGSGRSMNPPPKLKQSIKNQTKLLPSEVLESTDAKLQQPKKNKSSTVKDESSLTKIGSDSDEIYDGIPRYPRANSQKSRSTRTKEGLGRAGTFGIEKAVKVLDTLGSSMTNLNRNSGFAAGVTVKGNEVSILAFEVANTIVKGYSLMESVSDSKVQQLKEVVLSSEGVQYLVSKDMDELLKMVTEDKREELKIFAGEVIRFGNRCKDPQWHNLDRYFEKHNKDPPRQLREETDSAMQHFMTLVHHTADLYQELNTLDKMEQEHQPKHQNENKLNATQKGEALSTLKLELKEQKKKVKDLKKKSLWSKSMEEVMEKLVDIVLFLNREINNAFCGTNANNESNGPLSIQRRLGPSGLSLHYANIVQQIDSIVARSTSVPSSTREFLYQNLPPCIKSSLRSKLQTFHVKEELTVPEIKTEMEKTLHWLAPIATNTSKAHHGFGWVGEWATRTEVNQKQNGPIEITRIETLHYADKKKTDDCILQLLLWLNYMTKQLKVSPMISQNRGKPQEKAQQSVTNPTNHPPPTVVIKDRDMLRDISNRTRTLGLSKSQNYECTQFRLRKNDRLTKSISHWPASKNDGFIHLKVLCSSLPMADFKLEKERSMDAIDGMYTIGSCN